MSYQDAIDADDIERMREDELHGTTTYRDKYRYLDAREDAERLVFGGDGPHVDLALVRNIAACRPVDSSKPPMKELIRRKLIVSVGEGWELSDSGKKLHAALVFLYGPTR